MPCKWRLCIGASALSTETRSPLLDLNDCDVGVRIGDVLYNSMAYADDITVFSTNAKDLQRLIDMCTMYSDRWRFKYGIDKSKCMIIGKSPFTCEPVWRLNYVSFMRNVDTIEILGNVFNSKGNNTSHVDNRLNKCRQSFYSLNSLGMSYPGAATEVQAHLYKSICQPVLTYGMECMSNSKDQFRRMESIQGRLIKQCLGLSKRSHNSAVLKALNIDKAQNIVNRNVLNLYHRIFKIDSPARSLMQFLLARYITYDTTVPGTLLDRVVSIYCHSGQYSGRPSGNLLLNAFLESVATNFLFKKTTLMAMLIRSDYYCTAATMSIVTLRNTLCFASLRRPCKYIDIGPML